MPHKHQAAMATGPSRDMEPLPTNFGPVFFQNQFRTKIDLPTKKMYPIIEGTTGIITGSNSGLGYDAARQLLQLGMSHLIMGVRSLERGKAAAVQLSAFNPAAKIDVWQLDMESYDSIQAFVKKCQDKLSRLDFAILNAGIGMMNFTKVPSTGHEVTIQVNHHSTALLAMLLIPVLKSKRATMAPGRLTVVNSVTAHLVKMPNKDKRPFLASFDDTSVTPFDAQEQYGASKLVNQVFLNKLSDYVSRDEVVINMVDPGLTKGTKLSRDAKGMVAVGAKVFFTIAGRPVDRGAATYIHAVFGLANDSHGCFLMNAKIAPLSCWYYSEGPEFTDVIWNETIQELSFAGVEEAIGLK